MSNEAAKKDTGGPAFPDEHEHGMTLRDWFAGQALMGMLSANPDDAKFSEGDDVERTMAAASYSVADAMLAERSKP